MKKYRFVKQEGKKREVLGETMTEFDANGKGLLVFKGYYNPIALEMFKREWARLKLDDLPVLVVPKDVEMEYVRFEEVEECVEAHAESSTEVSKYRQWFEDVDQALTLEEQENIKLKDRIERLEKALTYHSGLSVNAAIRQTEKGGK